MAQCEWLWCGLPAPPGLGFVFLSLFLKFFYFVKFKLAAYTSAGLTFSWPSCEPGQVVASEAVDISPLLLALSKEQTLVEAVHKHRAVCARTSSSHCPWCTTSLSPKGKCMPEKSWGSGLVQWRYHWPGASSSLIRVLQRECHGDVQPQENSHATAHHCMDKGAVQR